MNISKHLIQQLVFVTSFIIIAIVDSGYQAAELTAIQQENSSAWVWDLVIASIVLAFTLASGALSYAAMRQWKGKWSLSALLPMAVLFVWILVIIVAKVQSPESHKLWPFEIFAWAMLNMVYMVGVMTVKRIIEKELPLKNNAD